MDFVSRLESFLKLKNHLQNLNEEELTNLKHKAKIQNPWFTFENIDLAFKGILRMLDEGDLLNWTSGYSFKNTSEKNIGVIAAGNIPMVGFHDALCVLLSGHCLHIKLSHQDDVLLPYLFNILIQIDQEWKGKIMLVDKLKNIDAAVATGSDNSARYFEYYFKHIPSLIRKNRTSVAIINGEESQEDLTNLGDDIYQYFGFGCRNVAKVLLPRDFQITHLLDHLNHWTFLGDNHKFVNNYHYQRAIFSLGGIPFLDNGFSIFSQNKNLVSPTSVVYYDYYDNLTEVTGYLRQNSEKIQCVVANKKVALDNSIPFGKTQMPAVWEYADNVDTLKFLLDV